MDSTIVCHAVEIERPGRISWNPVWMGRLYIIKVELVSDQNKGQCRASDLEIKETFFHLSFLGHQLFIIGFRRSSELYTELVR